MTQSTDIKYIHFHKIRGKDLLVWFLILIKIFTILKISFLYNLESKMVSLTVSPFNFV